MFGQEGSHLAEETLLAIELQETDLAQHPSAPPQESRRAIEDVKFVTLDVELEQVGFG
jgi:hypothetical protein